MESFGYDAAGELTSDTLKSPAGDQVAAIDYGYDAAGELTSQDTYGIGTTTPTTDVANTYTYDEAGQLASWSNGTTTTSYAYDGDGNRTCVTTSSEGCTAANSTYTYDARDELTADGSNTYTYAADGDLASRTIDGGGTTDYTFDALGRMTADGAQTYTYDALGRTLTDGSAALTYSGTGNDVASDGTAVYERDPSGGVIATQTTGSSVVTQTMTDAHQDMVAQFVPAATGLAAWQTYDPLGNVAGKSYWSAALGYQSGYTSNGKVNMDARWYSPASGQFDSADTVQNSPLPNPANANPYSYANGSPLDGTDPSGHDFVDGGGGGGEGDGDPDAGPGGGVGVQDPAGLGGASDGEPLTSEELAAWQDIVANYDAPPPNDATAEELYENLEVANESDLTVEGYDSVMYAARQYAGYLAYLQGGSAATVQCAEAGTCIAWAPGGGYGCHGTACIPYSPSAGGDAPGSGSGGGSGYSGGHGYGKAKPKPSAPVCDAACQALRWLHTLEHDSAEGRTDINPGSAAGIWNKPTSTGASAVGPKLAAQSNDRVVGVPPSAVLPNQKDRDGCLGGASAAEGNAWVAYGDLDEQGRATGVTACLDAASIGMTGRGRDSVGSDTLWTGSDTNRSGNFDPPGYMTGVGLARCHLLGRQNGGSGTDMRNLFACSQRGVNTGTGSMRTYEDMMSDWLKADQTVYYSGWITYNSNDPLDAVVHMYAVSSGGMSFDKSWQVVAAP